MHRLSRPKATWYSCRGWPARASPSPLLSRAGPPLQATMNSWIFLKLAVVPRYAVPQDLDPREYEAFAFLEWPPLPRGFWGKESF